MLFLVAILFHADDFCVFFCFVLFVSIIVGDAIEIDYFLIVVPIATFLSTCWYSFSLVRLLLYFDLRCDSFIYRLLLLRLW